MFGRSERSPGERSATSQAGRQARRGGQRGGEGLVEGFGEKVMIPAWGMQEGKRGRHEVGVLSVWWKTRNWT